MQFPNPDPSLKPLTGIKPSYSFYPATTTSTEPSWGDDRGSRLPSFAHRIYKHCNPRLAPRSAPGAPRSPASQFSSPPHVTHLLN